MYQRERPVHLYHKTPSQCNRCGRLIGFTQNRNGKWYAINVFPFKGGFAYYGGYGNHGNMKAEIHNCDPYATYFPYYAEREEVLPNRDEMVAMIEEYFRWNYEGVMEDLERGHPIIKEVYGCRVMES